MNYETMRQALLAFRRVHGHAAMTALLQKHAGVSAMTDVPPRKYADVIAATKSKPAAIDRLAAGIWNRRR